MTAKNMSILMTNMNVEQENLISASIPYRDVSPDMESYIAVSFDVGIS